MYGLSTGPRPATGLLAKDSFRGLFNYLEYIEL